MGSPVSLTDVNLFMEQLQRQVRESYTGNPPTRWYHDVNETGQSKG